MYGLSTCRAWTNCRRCGACGLASLHPNPDWLRSAPKPDDLASLRLVISHAVSPPSKLYINPHDSFTTLKIIFPSPYRRSAFCRIAHELSKPYSTSRYGLSPCIASTTQSTSYSRISAIRRRRAVPDSLDTSPYTPHHRIMTSILSPHSYTIMQSEGNEAASPRSHPRRQNSKQNRPSSNSHNHETQSDSNMPHSSTPKSRKTPRQNQQGDRAASLAVSSTRPPNSNSNARHRPASAAAGQNNLTATPSKPSYAGAAFHASPAPSTLPVPKFFSKSVPVANAESGLQAKMEREGDRSDSNEPPLPHLAPPPSRAEVKSPLDMFFNADRQEKARRQNTNIETQTSISNSRSETPSRSRDMFMLELDESSSPVTSNHATPVGKFRSSAIEQFPNRPENLRTPHAGEVSRVAQTESLKSFLNIASAETGGNSPGHSSYQPSPQQLHPFSTPSHNPPQQDPGLLYGNRNLSPLFQASRSPATAPTSQQSFSPSGPYASVYANPYSTSPSKSGPPVANSSVYGNTVYAQSHSPIPSPGPRTPYTPGSGSQQSYNRSSQQNGPQFSTDGTADIKDMEDRMKRMLRMS
ncbi:hypothetical protein ANO11243_048280 [Dothideomycetidae sp. 11243]|nr:hypothetical protein ANO11243_048280 [fungal sp. No.11243]